MRSFFDEENNLKPVSEWTEAQGAQVASMEVIIKNAAAGDGQGYGQVLQGRSRNPREMADFRIGVHSK